jgi:hypothetical protein
MSNRSDIATPEPLTDEEFAELDIPVKIFAGNFNFAYLEPRAPIEIDSGVVRLSFPRFTRGHRGHGRPKFDFSFLSYAMIEADVEEIGRLLFDPNHPYHKFVRVNEAAAYAPLAVGMRADGR